MRQGNGAQRGTIVPAALACLFVVGIGLILGTVLVASAGSQSSGLEPGPTEDHTPDAAKTVEPASSGNPARTPTASPTPSATPPPIPSPTPRPSPTRAAQVTLAEAIEAGLVQAQISGDGSPGHGFSSGDVIHIGLTRTGAARLEIELPKGTVLLNTTPGFQDMVVAAVTGITSGPTDRTYFPTSKMVLDDDEEQWFLVEAYCLDLYGQSPEFGSNLTVGGTAAPEVLAVLNTAAQMGREAGTVRATQIAVWATTQNPSRAQVEARVSVDDEDFGQARTVLEAAGADPASMQMFQY